MGITLDLTNLKVYVIDPENCTDADDAFSIITEPTETILWLFIADPTREMSFHEFMKSDILQKGITKRYNKKV